MPSDQAVRDKVDKVMLESCSKLTDTQEQVRTVNDFIQQLMAKPTLLTTPEVSVFDVGQSLGWTAEEAQSEMLAALAVEIAAGEGMDISSGAPTDWITQAFPMQSILRHAFLKQKALQDDEGKTSKRYTAAKRKHERLQKTINFKKSRSEKALSTAVAALEVPAEDKAVKLSRRNAQNRMLKNVKKARKIRATDDSWKEEACFVGCRVGVHNSQLMSCLRLFSLE